MAILPLAWQLAGATFAAPFKACLFWKTICCIFQKGVHQSVLLTGKRKRVFIF